MELPVDSDLLQLSQVVRSLTNSDDRQMFSFFLNNEEIMSVVAATLGASSEFGLETILPIVFQPQALFRVRSVGLCTSTLPGHTEAVLCVQFSSDGQRLATASGDTTVVTCVRWSGSNLIYSTSQDRTIKAWNPDDGRLIRTLHGHAHWVNSLSLSTDYALRTGAFGHRGSAPSDPAEAQAVALERYRQAEGGSGNGDAERIVSCSDDFTMFLWKVGASKPVARLTGHQQPVNDLQSSPDGRLIATASFDHSIRLWDGVSGKFVATLRGHVQAVYSVAWSADSRLIVSGSRDSTVKVFEVRTRKLLRDLPGHADEVFGIDWSPDGHRVASGGRDRVIKFWRR